MMKKYIFLFFIVFALFLVSCTDTTEETTASSTAPEIALTTAATTLEETTEHLSDTGENPFFSLPTIFRRIRKTWR